LRSSSDDDQSADPIAISWPKARRVNCLKVAEQISTFLEHELPQPLVPEGMSASLPIAKACSTTRTDLHGHWLMGDQRSFAIAKPHFGSA
jgi:hypothetical protein